jgi:hypothetical protein
VTVARFSPDSAGRRRHGRCPATDVRTSSKEQHEVRNRLIATGAGLLGGLETLAFLIVLCSR